MYIHPSAWQAIAQLEANGHQAYVVGGCVRDSLMGIAPHDWDICTSALPRQAAACFPGAHVIETGLKHGTITVVLAGQPLEITTYRVDGGYADNRHPTQVTFVDTLREDLARRDFTINAMAYHPDRGLQDFFGGRQDVENRLLRTVGSPDQRFGEDGLRIMRALRFAARLGFAIGQETADSIHQNRALLTHISAERLNVELTSLLLGQAAQAVLLAYPDVLAVFLPEIAPMVGFQQNHPYHPYDLWQHTAISVGAAPPQRAVRLAMLLHDIGKPSCQSTGADGNSHYYGHPAQSATMARAALKRLKFDNHTLEAVCQLVECHDAAIQPHRLPRWLNRLGEERLRQLLAVQRADILAQAPATQPQRLAALEGLEARLEQLLAEGQCFQLKDLAINGQDLLALGMKPGKAVGRALQRLLGLVLDGVVPNQREALLAQARRFLS